MDLDVCDFDAFVLNSIHLLNFCILHEQVGQPCTALDTRPVQRVQVFFSSCLVSVNRTKAVTTTEHIDLECSGSVCAHLFASPFRSTSPTVCLIASFCTAIKNDFWHCCMGEIMSILSKVWGTHKSLDEKNKWKKQVYLINQSAL